MSQSKQFLQVKINELNSGCRRHGDGLYGEQWNLSSDRLYGEQWNLSCDRRVSIVLRD